MAICGGNCDTSRLLSCDVLAYFLGLFVEYEWGPHVSLVVFLALYFVFLWVAWQFAVRLSKPRVAEQAAA